MNKNLIRIHPGNNETGNAPVYFDPAIREFIGTSPVNGCTLRAKSWDELANKIGDAVERAEKDAKRPKVPLRILGLNEGDKVVEVTFLGAGRDGWKFKGEVPAQECYRILRMVTTNEAAEAAQKRVNAARAELEAAEMVVRRLTLAAFEMGYCYQHGIDDADNEQRVMELLRAQKVIP